MKQEIQLEVIKNIAACAWCPPQKPGAVIWVNAEQARHLLEEGVCRYVGGNEPRSIGPSETPEVGPSQIKKSFVGQTDGPLTDSPSSSASGPSKPSFASAAVLVPPQRL